MDAIWTWIGSIFGYIVQFLYTVFRNYGVAIILFTIVTRVLMLPLTIKQQKTQAANARLQPKLEALKRQYGNSREQQMEYNQALQELYEKENVSPSAGCLPMLIQFPIFFGLYRAICMPLTCVLHLGDKVEALRKLFDISKTSGAGFRNNGFYYEIRIIEAIRNVFENGSVAVSSTDVGGADISVTPAMVTEILGERTESIVDMSNSFRFLGIDLLQTPAFWNVALIMSVIVFITAAGGMIISNKITMKNSPQMKGCNMNVMAIFMGGFSTYISFLCPAAMALYWSTSSAIAPLQSYLVQKYYGTGVINARTESQRRQTLQANEKRIIDEINAVKGEKKFAPVYEAVEKKQEKNTAAKNSPKKNSKNKKKGGSGNNSGYQGKKK